MGSFPLCPEKKKKAANTAFPRFPEESRSGVGPLYLLECSGVQGHRAGLGRVTGGRSRILNLSGLGAPVCAHSAAPVSCRLSLRTGSPQEASSTLSQQGY